MSGAFDFTKLLNKLDPIEDGPSPTYLRKGTVIAINGDGTVNVALSDGVTIANVPRLAGSEFMVSDRVQVLTHRGSLLVLGKVASTAGGVNPNYWALVGTPTITNNSNSSLTPTSWPLNNGGLYPGSGITLTIPASQGGVYDIGIYLRYAAQATVTGRRDARIIAYGGEHAVFSTPTTTNSFNGVPVTAAGVKRSYLAGGATISFEAFQNSGVSLALLTDSSVWLERVG